MRHSAFILFILLLVYSAPAESLLVIAPEAFQPELREFIAHKQKLLPTESRSLESILNQTSGVDDPEKLKRFLYNRWREHGLRYALLVGDADVLPVRYMALDRITPTAHDYAFYPSDLYYSDLAKQDGSFDDWNARKEGFHAGYFGEVRGEKHKKDPINYDKIDYLPDIAIGRWPVNTPAQVRTIVAKTISYENQVLSGKASRNAAFLAVDGWVDSRPLLDKVSAPLTNQWHLEKRYYGSTPPPDHHQLRSLLNQGSGLVIHTGHGQTDAWEKCFSLGDLDRITNSSSLPIIMSAGCSTAYFAPLPPYGPYMDVAGNAHKGTDHGEDFKAPPAPPSPYQRAAYNPTGLGEQLLYRSSNGALAYIGCNTGSQPCGLTLLEGFVNAIATQRHPRLGDCWSSAIRHYYDKENLSTLKPTESWYPASIFFQPMKFMTFGDPTLLLPPNHP